MDIKSLFHIGALFACVSFNTCIAQNDCATKKTGDFCFENKSSQTINVQIFNRFGSDYNWMFPDKYLTIAPGDKECLYQNPADPYGYRITSLTINENLPEYDQNRKKWTTLKQGELLIEACKSKTLTLNANGGTTLSETSTTVAEKAAAITFTQNNAPGNAPAQEPKSLQDTLYRSSGDPLKGLNISKTKEITSGNYHALIIGIDKYSGQWAALNNAVHDAQSFEKTLRNKYKIDKFYTLYDAKATRSAIMNLFETLVNTLKEDDNVVIYFSGHGEFKKTMNKGYWVPYDAKTNAVSDLISNNDIQTFLASIKSKHTLLISDACFSGDIFRGNTISIPFEESDKYYTKVYNLNSRQALTSGGNEPVMDGGKDGHSVFAYYLIKNLENNTNKYFDITQLYNNLKIPVVNNSDQTPRLDPIKNTGDEGGQFIFIRK